VSVLKVASVTAVPPSFQSVAHACDVVRRAEKFEPVQVRHGALAADDVAGDAEVLAEIGVACGDHSTDEVTMLLLVEEADHLFGDGALLDAAPLPAP
jgi:hypothetical protein